MLDYLRIRDLALIEDMELEFAPGMNVLTGETGAGKSFIIKALNFLTGDRLTTDLVRPGKEKAVAEALFILPNGGELALRRELAADSGRSRLFLNNSLTSQESIRDLRPALLLHASQHGQQQLLQPAFQASVLDSYMNRPELLAARDGLLRDLRGLAARRAALEARSAALAEKRDMLEFQQQEIDKVAPQPGEEEQLEERRSAMRQAAVFRQSVEQALDSLHGRNGSGLLEQLSLLGRSVRALAAADEAFAPDAQPLEDARLFLADLDSRLRRAGTGHADAADAEALEARLFALAQLKRRLRRSLDEILALREEIADNLSFLDSCRLDLAQLDKEESGLCASLARALADLNAARREAAAALAAALEKELRGLGFSEHARVSFAFAPVLLHPGREDCAEQRARLLWQPNPGQPAQPLDRIASGGELSRFLLALVSLISRRSSDVPTLIFDEVDAGVGGLTLGRVAERLASLARDRQVLLITHWPQLAAAAQRHFQVRKEVRHGETLTLCQRLETGQVGEELARMAGGGPQGNALAKELLAGR